MQSIVDFLGRLTISLLGAIFFSLIFLVGLLALWGDSLYYVVTKDDSLPLLSDLQDRMTKVFGDV